jgi:hypothetical protein
MYICIVMLSKLNKNMLDTEISYPKLIITESLLVIKPNLNNQDYWLFDTVWQYGSKNNYIDLYSSISGYGKLINDDKSYGIITIRESMSNNNIENFLTENKITEICDKTKIYFSNILKSHNIKFNLNNNVLETLQ